LPQPSGNDPQVVVPQVRGVHGHDCGTVHALPSSIWPLQLSSRPLSTSGAPAVQFVVMVMTPEGSAGGVARMVTVGGVGGVGALTETRTRGGIGAVTRTAPCTMHDVRARARTTRTTGLIVRMSLSLLS
jgi:hypothetical protein